ncbi:ribokinase [Nonomuraea rhodomycinica]|uniref:Ribokinase n=1 Tax=Nonomuraea rhodomycinica TaxID=1712872 RepID=A0A7Y6IU69_9ACTN|nr:ribokinase [Nonomuraea rhodomycinica]NUW44456.1 ribokinase [Nonomuraea rhodomycinica]
MPETTPRNAAETAPGTTAGTARELELVVVGSLNMDLTVPVTRLPGRGETVAGAAVVRAAGGKGANQAVAAARLGARVRLVGQVGDDALGRELLAAVAGEGVDVSGVRRVPAATGMAMIVVEDGGENMITVAPGANSLFHLTDPGSAATGPGSVTTGLDLAGPGSPATGLDLARADALLLQLEIPVAACLAAARQARAHGVPVILNAAPYTDGLDDLLPLVDLLIVNESEADALCRGADPAGLLALGPRAAVVTLGGRGARGRDASGACEAPSFRVPVVDAVGAGDTFCAQLALAHAAGLPLADAVRRACAAGALATTAHGAQTAMPTGGQVERLLARAS